MADIKKAKVKKEKDAVDRWLLTYADMITLLLLFFIILYTMSKVDAKKYDELSQALGMVFGGGSPVLSMESHTITEGGKGIMFNSDMQNAYPHTTKRAFKFAMSYEKLRSLLKPEIKARKVRIIENENGLIVTLASDIYFGSGSAKVNQDALKVLNVIAGVIKELSNSVNIAGYTDDRSVGGETNGTEESQIGMDDKIERYRSNWELSAQRAINVLKYFVLTGVPRERLSATAFGDTRALESNDTPEGRAYNRRVDIVILANE